MLVQDRRHTARIGGRGFLRSQIIRLLAILWICSGLSACASSLYSVPVGYEPSATVIPPADSGRKMIVTVAQFNDVRPGGKDLKIGNVTTALGGLNAILPKNLKPEAAVSAVVKDILVKAKYRVSVTMPEWNLQEDAIRKEWGQIVIGGNIEALEITCQKDVPVIAYRSKVRLSFVFADVQSGKIFYRVTTESTNTLEHLYFSEAMLAKQISITLSEAAEKAFEGNTVKEKIRDVLK